jgi:plasmid replication initiation protein
MSKKEIAIKQADIVRRVNMSNALTRAAQNLTLAEKRLVMLAVSKLDSTQPATPQSMIVTVTAEEFAREFDVSMDTAYDELQSAGKQLFPRYISFHWDAGANLTHMHWVGRATYKDKEGKIELAFWHELAPQLFDLNGLFTSYRLSRVSALRSFYSWRLFDLLMQFRKTGWLKIPIADFCHAVEAPERYRKDSGQLRRAVIEPAVKEIREKDGLDLTWEAIKAGRKVVMLEFKFPKEKEKQEEATESAVEPPNAAPTVKPRGRPKKAATPPEYTPNTITREEIERHARPGESYEQAGQRLRGLA